MALALRLRRAAAALSTTVAPAITASSPQFFSLSKPNPVPLLSGNPNPSVHPLRFLSFHSGQSDTRDPKPFAEDEILFEGCDYNHWLITMDFPKDPKPTPEEMVETYVQTLAKVVGSVEEAKKRMYACSTTTYQGFQAVMTEDMSEKFRGLPGVVFILPDSYIDPVNKEYGGDKYDNGVITPRPPPVQYGRQGRYGDQNRRYNQPRYDGQRGPASEQGNPPRDGQPPVQGGGRYPPQQNYGPPRQNGGNYGPGQNFGPPRQDGGNYAPQQNFGQPRQDRGNYAPQQNFGPPRQDGGNYAPQQNYAPPRQDGSGFSPPGGRDGYQRDFTAGGRDAYEGERRNPMPNYQRDFSQGQQGHSTTPVERNFAQGQGGDYRQGSNGAYNGAYRQGAVPTYTGGNGQEAGSGYGQNTGPAESQYQAPQQGRF